MAPDPVTQERIYQALRNELLSDAFRAGQRIEVQSTADRHRASATPVREALLRLVGERLCELNPDGGFRVTEHDLASLQQLYHWNGQHLLSAISVAPGPAIQKVFETLDPIRDKTPLDHAVTIAGLFRALGEATGNMEFADQVETASARLHHARLAEAMLFPDLRREIANLARASGSDAQKSVRRRVLAYHRRRIEHASQIARLMAV